MDAREGDQRDKAAVALLAGFSDRGLACGTGVDQKSVVTGAGNCPGGEPVHAPEGSRRSGFAQAVGAEPAAWGREPLVAVLAAGNLLACSIHVEKLAEPLSGEADDLRVSKAGRGREPMPDVRWEAGREGEVQQHSPPSRFDPGPPDEFMGWQVEPVSKVEEVASQ